MESFVIEFNRKTLARRVHHVPSTRDASMLRLELEARRSSDDIEIVALVGKSLDSLTRTHSRYFNGAEAASV
ncbi:hypothetical protein [Tomitella gaofuii]|uniref:hypothetical protein n=1 Tax=Tomitella gaofuii TaxID=2760083 RepID=UPI0015F8FE2F|nr:hypothetical protein [Tomitella gaofuii]